MYGLSEQTIEKLTNLFRSFTAIDEVILYGSRARGDNSNGSDIDLTLIGDNLTTDKLFKFRMLTQWSNILFYTTLHFALLVYMVLLRAHLFEMLYEVGRRLSIWATDQLCLKHLAEM